MMIDAAYREFVQRIARGSDRPSELILNRSPEHAAVILESLFQTANQHVHILTNSLLPTAYSCAPVIDAARDFLRRVPNGEITILAELDVDRSQHALLRALDADGAAERVALLRVPESLSEQYKFNFAVADGESYRFERERTSAEAAVTFRDQDFGASLERWFQGLRALVVDNAPQVSHVA